MIDNPLHRGYSVYGMSQREITTIQVTKELKDFLSSQATRKGETYDQILKRLLGKIWHVKFEGKEAQNETGKQ